MNQSHHQTPGADCQNSNPKTLGSIPCLSIPHKVFSFAPHGVRTSGLWILSPMLYRLSHPVTPENEKLVCKAGKVLSIEPGAVFMSAGKAIRPPTLPSRISPPGAVI